MCCEPYESPRLAMTDNPPSVVDELVGAVNDFTLSLRSRQGFDEELHSRVVDALHRCAEAWRGDDCIPRLAANVLVALEPWMLASADLYEPPLRERIIDEAIRIGDLAIETVAV